MVDIQETKIETSTQSNEERISKAVLDNDEVLVYFTKVYTPMYLYKPFKMVANLLYARDNQQEEDTWTLKALMKLVVTNVAFMSKMKRFINIDGVAMGSTLSVISNIWMKGFEDHNSMDIVPETRDNPATNSYPRGKCGKNVIRDTRFVLKNVVVGTTTESALGLQFMKNHKEQDVWLQLRTRQDVKNLCKLHG